MFVQHRQHLSLKHLAAANATAACCSSLGRPNRTRGHENYRDVAGSQLRQGGVKGQEVEMDEQQIQQTSAGLMFAFFGDYCSKKTGMTTYRDLQKTGAGSSTTQLSNKPTLGTDGQPKHHNVLPPHHCRLKQAKSVHVIGQLWTKLGGTPRSSKLCFLIPTSLGRQNQ